MFKPMTRGEKQLSPGDTLDLLKQAEEGVLATIGADGYPYAVPLNFVYHGGAVIFHCGKSGHKLDNIAHNDRVSFCVIHGSEIVPQKFDTLYKSVVIFGRVVELLDREKEEGLVALVQRFSSNYLEAGKKYIDNSKHKTRVFKIEIEHITGKIGK